ncbi:M4 family metallopeptidase [Acinetobacter rudis]|uniref:Neutral metalloproteinase n=1 Tax=Acinetobacter rudis TaxID=632955 RepID=A0AAW8J6W5_9GAMM|nr:M4 family metallopeptidase [Acinetobacter rudis]MDQ8935464.1 M4 family metallopeptidase [Acinetobacter rudis]MDQ8953538.1 M4 family metallopeptidase [Acinetobacter rudis]MDQ9017769.1 M4 family metallopeptidase [Acinetobacter rudis]
MSNHSLKMKLAQAQQNRGQCFCFIIPPKVFERFLEDNSFSQEQKQNFKNEITIDNSWREFKGREVKKCRKTVRHLGPLDAVDPTFAPSSKVTIFDCKNSYSLPGAEILKVEESDDPTVQHVLIETQAIIKFFDSVFIRNSIDDQGIDIVSSVHYGVAYNNAFWNGIQMTYGDGDGNLFIDFTSSSDVIAHELSHGFIQYSAGFEYENQAGGLNESMADVFGSMFKQWRNKQNVHDADWLIGKEILGPAALYRGFRSLRNLSNPSDPSCLSPQPAHFSEYVDGMDPHESSGIANFAFYQAAMQVGGYSWEKVGQIWYKALVAFDPNPQMEMQFFANRTRFLAKKMFAHDTSVYKAVNQAWLTVGL